VAYEPLAYIGLFLVMITSMELLVGNNLRLDIIALAVQYLAVFFLIIQAWPLGLATVKLITGWMAVALIVSVQIYRRESMDVIVPQTGQIFRLLVGVLIWVLIFSVTTSITRWLPVPNIFLWSGMILIGIGMLQLSMSTIPIRNIFGLLTAFSGFEILYAAMENSVLVTSLLAMITIGLAVIAAFYISPIQEVV
jgi:hypothetical protein